MPKTYRLIDVFAGCGGMTRGFVDSGRFEPVHAIEMDRDAAATYRANFGAHIEARPIQEVAGYDHADVVIGGPPCQGFSRLNREGVGLERRGLWRNFLDVVRASGARAFVMENVPALLASPEYEDLLREAESPDMGFTVIGRPLLAADYGVPQLRRRAVVVGLKDGIPEFPSQTHSRLGVDLPPWRTFHHAVTEPAPLSGEPDGFNWHRARRPTEVSIERYRTIPNEGEGRFELFERRPDLTPPCWQRKATGTTDVFGRLWWDKPAPTIRTEFFKPEKGRYLHPSEHRPITVREAARCQSFPDDFDLPEEQSMTSIARQIGNAVPPLLARRVAETLAAQLDAARHTTRRRRTGQRALMCK